MDVKRKYQFLNTLDTPSQWIKESSFTFLKKSTTILYRTAITPCCTG